MPEEGLAEPNDRNVKIKAAVRGGQMNRGKALKGE